VTLEGGVALVTGATGGVGGAIAARLVQAGMTVCATSRTPDSFSDLLALAPAPCRIEPYVADLGTQDSVRDLCERIRERHDALHVLVHAAGAIAIGSTAESQLQDFDRQYRVNVRAPYQITQALLPEIARGRGQVVFVNSSAGRTARAGVAQYAATKHALKALADSLRAEVNPTGVRVLSVFLGRTATPMQAMVHRLEGRPYVPEKLIQPDDVASVVLNALQLPRTAEVTDLHIRPMIKT
jgi:NADP-dependent 3-hydroxy acid dehydrogenase YdfG